MMKKKKGYNVGGQVPGQKQARQMSAFNRSQASNRSQARAMNTADTQANQRNMAKANRKAAAKGPTQQPRKLSATEMAAFKKAKGPARQARQVSATEANAMRVAQAQRNMAQAQRKAAAKGPTQKARRAPTGSGTPGARKMTPVEAQRITRTRPSTSRPPSRRRGLFSRRR